MSDAGKKLTKALYDKHGIPIERGDLVKIYHFTGARRKRHFMYHQALGTQSIGPSGMPYMMFSHLNFIEDRRQQDGPYPELLDGRVLSDYEIIQSIDCKFEQRPRLTASGRSALAKESANG